MEIRVYVVCQMNVLYWLFCVPRYVRAHGRLIEPPSRASMWRYGYQTPPDYLDNQLFCGGFGVQWNINQGKCGICGDPWNSARDHEAGGKYATGIIVRRYDVGSILHAVVQLTASHQGYFEFRICPVNNPNIAATWDCLNKHVLSMADGSGTRYYVVHHGAYNHQIRLQLPSYLECSQCVLQWKYNAGNSWGVDHNGKGCRGCGRQEQFYGCSDIAIGAGTEFVPYVPPHTTVTSIAVVTRPSPITPDAKELAILDLLFGKGEKLASDDNSLDFSSDEWLAGNLNFDMIENTTLSPLRHIQKEAAHYPLESAKELDVNFKSSPGYDLTLDNRVEKLRNDLKNIGINEPEVKLPKYPDQAFDVVGSPSYNYHDYYGVDDYEYVSAIKSVIEMLQKKLKRSAEAKSSLPILDNQMLSEPLNVPRSLKSSMLNTTTTKDRLAYGDHFVNTTTNTTNDTTNASINMEDSMDGSGSDAIYSQEHLIRDIARSEELFKIRNTSVDYDRATTPDGASSIDDPLLAVDKNANETSSLFKDMAAGNKIKVEMCHEEDQGTLQRKKPAPTRTYSLLAVLKMSRNSWGKDAETNQSCVGCGRQEQFYACADVAIGQGVLSRDLDPVTTPFSDHVNNNKTRDRGDRKHVGAGACAEAASKWVLCCAVALVHLIRSV